jgi:hypothetical protein
LALGAGIHPEIVSERLGHATVQLTLDRSSHVVEGLHERAPNNWAGLSFGSDARGVSDGA